MNIHIDLWLQNALVQYFEEGLADSLRDIKPYGFTYKFSYDVSGGWITFYGNFTDRYGQQHSSSKVICLEVKDALRHFINDSYNFKVDDEQ